MGLPSGVETTATERDIAPKSTAGEDTCTNPVNPRKDTHELPTYNHENLIGENERTLITGPKETDTPSEIDAKNEAPIKPERKSSKTLRTPNKYRDFVT